MSISTRLENIGRLLKDKGHKLTVQREAVVRVLLENENGHLSAEDVFMIQKETFPEIGLATIYRTLELLNELNIVEKMIFADGVARFNLRSEGHAHMHHHLICASCGKLKEIKDDWLSELENRLAREYGFIVTDHRLDFMGYFQACNGHDCSRTSKAVS
ncbi:Fur family transcriptional regulator [Paenibacillus chartarius]|uniref:Fur family transcriptional regulator n=1 Tax=Paenibacillus chartarius TaxID=747481 RepID=A0ABV6DTI0_9BACL